HRVKAVENIRAMNAADISLAKLKLLEGDRKSSLALWTSCSQLHAVTRSVVPTPDAVQADPAVARLPYVHIEPRPVRRSHFLGLALKYTGKHKAAARRHAVRQHGRKHLERIRQYIGHDDVELAGLEGIGQASRDTYAVLAGIVACGLHRELVDVDRVDARGAQHRSGNGQNARAAAVVEHGGATRQSGRQPFQAQMGGRMAAGSKGKARIQLDAYNAARLGVRKRQHGIFRMPAGNYP